METGQLKTLLDKYFEGLTNLKEEQTLLDYFSGDVGDLPEWNTYKQYFTLLKATRIQSIHTPAFEKRLDAFIDGQAITPKVVRFPLLRFAAAASIALILGISSFLLIRSQLHQEKDTFSDPQLAYAEAQKTLLYISGKMNRGIEPLSNVSKINAGTEQLKNLNKLDNGLTMLNFISFINKSSNLKK